MNDTGLLQDIRRAQRPAIERLYTFEEETDGGGLAIKGGGEEMRELLYGGSDSLFCRLVKSLIGVINERRKSQRLHHMEFMDIWPHYNSLILSDKWENGKLVPKRVTITDSYHWKRGVTGVSNVVSLYGPVSHWFNEFLNVNIRSEIGINDKVSDDLFPPSIHKYMVSEDRSGQSESAIIISNQVNSRYSDESIRKEEEVIARDKEKIKYIIFEDDNIGAIKKSLEKIFENRKDWENIDIDEWDKIVDIWVTWYSVYLKKIFYGDVYKKTSIDPINERAHKAEESSSKINNKKWVSRSSVNCMTTIRIRVPGTNNELGSIMIFSDKSMSKSTVKIIDNIVWPIFAYLRQIERRLVGYGWLMDKGVRSAVASIMARNASHNAGSHSLAHLLNKNFESGSDDDLTEDQRDKFLRYLKGRMDFVAEITTYWRELPWLEQ